MRIITPLIYHRDESAQQLADAIMRRAELNPDTVAELRISEAGIEADILEIEDGKPVACRCGGTLHARRHTKVLR